MTSGIVPIPDAHTPIRRVWHVVGGLSLLAPYATGLLERAPYTLLLAGVFAFLLVLDVLRLRSRAVRVVFVRCFGRLMLPRDVARLNGTTYFSAGILLAVLLLPRVEAIVGSLFLVLGDAAAGLVGSRWGRIRLTPEGKSLEGSAACFLVCLAVAVPLVGWRAGFAGALAATLIEFLKLPLDDNLLIPPLAGAVLLWVG